MEEKEIIINIVATKYHVADALRELANHIENCDSEEDVYHTEYANNYMYASIEEDA